MTISRLFTHALPLQDGGLLVVGNDGGMFSGLRDDSARADLGVGSPTAWTQTASLNAPRGGFAAVRLADGRVLVTGGANQGGTSCTAASDSARRSYSSTYRFDPAQGAWERVGLLATARTDPAIALLPDGRVLVAGGYYRVQPDYGAAPGDGQARLAAFRAGGDAGSAQSPADVDPPTIGRGLATAELFDPATGTWSTTGSMRYARYGGIAVTLSDGRVLIAGSEPGSGVASIAAAATSTAEIYDPATGRFTLTGSLPALDLAKMFPGLPSWANLTDPAPYANGSLVALSGGDALLVGNTWWWKHQGEVSRDLRYSAARGTWTVAGRAWLDAWTHDAVPKTWTSGVNHYLAAVVPLADGRVLVAGGTTSIQYQGDIHRTVELYSPATSRWTAGASLPQPRAGAVATRLANGDIMLVGGFATDEDRWSSCDHAGGTGVVLRFVP